jgi:hypothetical protein
MAGDVAQVRLRSSVQRIAGIGSQALYIVAGLWCQVHELWCLLLQGAALFIIVAMQCMAVALAQAEVWLAVQAGLQGEPVECGPAHFDIYDDYDKLDVVGPSLNVVVAPRMVHKLRMELRVAGSGGDPATAAKCVAADGATRPRPLAGLATPPQRPRPLFGGYGAAPFGGGPAIAAGDGVDAHAAWPLPPALPPEGGDGGDVGDMASIAADGLAPAYAKRPRPPALSASQRPRPLRCEAALLHGGADDDCDNSEDAEDRVGFPAGGAAVHVSPRPRPLVAPPRPRPLADPEVQASFLSTDVEAASPVEATTGAKLEFEAALLHGGADDDCDNSEDAEDRVGLPAGGAAVHVSPRPRPLVAPPRPRPLADPEVQASFLSTDVEAASPVEATTGAKLEFGERRTAVPVENFVSLPAVTEAAPVSVGVMKDYGGSCGDGRQEAKGDIFGDLDDDTTLGGFLDTFGGPCVVAEVLRGRNLEASAVDVLDFEGSICRADSQEAVAGVSACGIAVADDPAVAAHVSWADMSGSEPELQNSVEKHGASLAVMNEVYGASLGVTHDYVDNVAPAPKVRKARLSKAARRQVKAQNIPAAQGPQEDEARFSWANDEEVYQAARAFRVSREEVDRAGTAAVKAWFAIAFKDDTESFYSANSKVVRLGAWLALQPDSV